MEKGKSNAAVWIGVAVIAVVIIGAAAYIGSCCTNGDFLAFIRGRAPAPEKGAAPEEKALADEDYAGTLEEMSVAKREFEDNSFWVNENVIEGARGFDSDLLLDETSFSVLAETQMKPIEINPCTSPSFADQVTFFGDSSNEMVTQYFDVRDGIDQAQAEGNSILCIAGGLYGAAFEIPSGITVIGYDDSGNFPDPENHFKVAYINPFHSGGVSNIYLEQGSSLQNVDIEGTKLYVNASSPGTVVISNIDMDANKDHRLFIDETGNLVVSNSRFAYHAPYGYEELRQDLYPVIMATGPISHASIDGNVFEVIGSGTRPAAFSNGQGGEVAISDNYFYFPISNELPGEENRIRNNMVRIEAYDDPILKLFPNTEFHNNTVVIAETPPGTYDEYGGILDNPDNNPAEIYNNIFFHPDAPYNYRLRVIEDPPDTPNPAPSFDHNLVYSTANLENSGYDASQAADNIIDQDPEFVNWPDENYCLKASSPAKGAGRSGANMGAIENSFSNNYVTAVCPTATMKKEISW